MTNEIDKLQLQIDVNSKGTLTKLNNITKSIDRLNASLSKMQSIGGVLDMTGGGATTSGTSKKSSATKKGGGLFNLGKLTKNLNLGALVGKLYFVRNVTKRLASSVADIVQYGIDFTETLNLWQTAMRGNVAEARTFVSEMNKAYGVAEKTLMNYQATFKNMLSSLGSVAEQTAYKLSESLTQMALDFSSLYNVSIEDAMTKFQAVLSGQVRPIRSISGYDITENTIYQLYQSLGGTKTMRQLSQTEKRLLRILAVFQQMSDTGALGDLSKTLSTNANQLRIMKEQAIELATWLGNAVSYLIQESGILVTVNTYLYTLKELAKSVAYEIGYTEENFIAGIFNDTQKANEELDELQGKLAGFDKFQVLSQANEDNFDIESVILDALSQYGSILDGVINPAQEASVSMLEKWGFHLEDIVDEETGATVQVWKWGEGTESLVDKIKELGKALAGIVSIIGVLKAPILTIATAIEGTYLTDPEFRATINDLLKLIGKALKDVGLEAFNLIKEILPKLLPIASQLLGLVQPLLSIIQSVLPIIEPIINSIIKLLPSVIKLINTLLPYIEDIIDELLPNMGSLLENLASLISTILDDLTSILPTILDMLLSILPVVDSLVYGVSSLVSLIDDIFKFFGSDWLDALGITWGLTFIGSMLEFIMNTLSTIITLTLGFGKALLTWDWESLGNQIKKIWDINNNPNIKNLLPETRKWLSPFADGGLPDKGSMFIAGEAGAELVTNIGGGQSAVMNMEQLQSAITRGMIVALSASESEQPININVNVGNDNWFNITRKVARQNGYDLVKVQ